MCKNFLPVNVYDRRPSKIGNYFVICNGVKDIKPLHEIQSDFMKERFDQFYWYEEIDISNIIEDEKPDKKKKSEGYEFGTDFGFIKIETNRFTEKQMNEFREKWIEIINRQNDNIKVVSDLVGSCGELPKVDLASMKEENFDKLLERISVMKKFEAYCKKNKVSKDVIFIFLDVKNEEEYNMLKRGIVVGLAKRLSHNVFVNKIIYQTLRNKWD